MTGVPDTAHHGGLWTAVRRVLWLAGLLLGLWLLSWIVADEARADGVGVHIPIVDQIVQPVVPDVGKALEPVAKAVQGLENGPVRDVLKPVAKIVKALPAPLPDVVTPVLKPVGGLIPDTGAVFSTSSATSASSAPEKVKPRSARTATPAASVATVESSATAAVGHDFRIPVVAKSQQSKTVMPKHHPTGHGPSSERPAAPAEQAPAITVGAAGSVADVVVHDAVPELTTPGRLVRPHGVFAPLWRSLKPGTSPG